MEKVILNIEDSGIAKIEINFIEKQNILSDEVMRRLNDILMEIESKKNKVKVLVIYSSSKKTFSAGGNVKEWNAYTKEEAYVKGINGARVFRRLEELPILTIAAISGICLGGGNELAMSCDYRIATKDSIFGQPEILLGNGLAWGGYYRLIKTVGLVKAKEMILFGEKYCAKEAREMNLINEVVDSWDGLQKKVTEISQRAAVNAPTLIVSKHILNEIGNQLVPVNSLVDGLSAAYFAESKASKKRKKAFFEKRLEEQVKQEINEL